MSKLVINTGSNPNDGTGDSLRDGADKINANFTEIYGALGPNTTLSVGFAKTVIGISATTFNVGIGSTNPTSKLQVVGDLSATSYKLGSTEIVSSGGQLKNISSLDSTTTATIESAVQAAPNSFVDLQITGISTFSNGPILVGSATSSGTLNQKLQVTGKTYISDDAGIGITNPTSRLHVVGDVLITGVSTVGRLSINTGLNAPGISTFGDVTISDLFLAGITTGINAPGISTLTAINGGNLSLAGITTGLNATAGIITAGGYVANQGTTTVAPIQLASTGALLTGNGTLGAIEYDGQNYYSTGVTTTGRGFIPSINSFRFNSNRAAQSPASGSINYFDPGLIPLTGNGVYEVDFDLYFTKGTTGITTFTLSTPTAPTNISAVLTATPVGGVSTNTAASPQLVSVVGGATTSTSLALTLNAATHYTKISVLVENGTNNANTLTLNTTNTGTITPLRGSRWKATLLTRTAGVGVTQ